MTFHIQDLSFGYFSRPLFAGVSLQLNAGELLHLQGRNGCGKTSFLKVLAGLLAPRKGTCLWQKCPDGLDPSAEYLPAETNGLFLQLTGLENLRFWSQLRLKKLPDQNLIEVLQSFSLAHPTLLQSFPVEKYSTGMKRKLALCRLQLSNAALWLLDEPLIGLDEEAGVEFKALVQSHLQRGGMVLATSHEVRHFSELGARRIKFGGDGGLIEG